MTPTPVAVCAFGPPATPEPGPSLEAYVFSEPSVVLTHTEYITILGGLPDGQRLLIARGDQGYEYIETFNVQTGALQRYGRRRGLTPSFDGPKAVWLASENAVAFTDITLGGRDVLRISWGEGVPEREVTIDLASIYFAANSDGRQLIFFSEAAKEPQIYDVAQNQTQRLPFILPPVDEAYSRMYQAAWQPNGNQIAFYSETGFYLADLSTGQLCEVDLGVGPGGKRWVVGAQWSPDGRYLAAQTKGGPLGTSFGGDLTIIDVNARIWYRPELGLQYPYALAWAPNSDDLVMLAEAGPDTSSYLHGLYLVSATTDGVRRMLVDYPFRYSGYLGIVWSASRQEIALGCPAIDPINSSIAEGRICIISVKTQ